MASTKIQKSSVKSVSLFKKEHIKGQIFNLETLTAVETSKV